jgi:hypothetical protein
VQAGAGVALAAGDADPPHGQRGGGLQVRPPLGAGDQGESPGRALGLLEVALLEVDVDEQGQQRADHGGLADRGDHVVRGGGGPLEQVPGQRQLASGQVEGGQGADGVRVPVEPLQQQGGLLQAALADAQVGQADHGRGAPLRHPPVEVAGGLEELALGLVPAPGRGEDAAVVGTAEGGHGVPAPQQVGGRAHPLVGSGDVVDQLAGPEEPAHDRVLGRHLAQLAGADGGQGLVEQDQALLDPVGHEVHAAEVRQGLELDVGVAEPAPDGDGVAQQRLTELGVGFELGADDQQPAALGPVLADLLEDRHGPREPPAPDRPLAEDAPGDPGDGAGRPAGGHAAALPAVGGVGPLVVGGRGGVLALQVQRLGQTFQGLARLGLGQGGPERTAGAGGVAQGRPALVDQGRAHPPMMARPRAAQNGMSMKGEL